MNARSRQFSMLRSMNILMSPEKPGPESPATLGAVLYAGRDPEAHEQEWAELVRAIAGGDQAALHALYERSHRIVFTLIFRLTANRETTEELTLDVFHDVWRRAARYDAAQGSVLAWIMNQARSRAIDRLRFENRKKRTYGGGEVAASEEAADPRDVFHHREQRAYLRAALIQLSPDERQALEATFLAGQTQAEAAVQLRQPLGTVKTRIRAALHKLRQLLRDE
jgi:RNA polymerase sigma-70 factor (ECF subfamily)